MARYKTRKFVYLRRGIVVMLVLIVSACGGGSSNSGGSGNVFLGKQEVRISQSRITTELMSTDFQLTRSANQITIADLDFTISAQLMGAQFTVTSPDIPIPNSGAGCSSFSVTYSGTISDSMVMGDIAGVLNCPLPATISGSFQASNQTSSGQSALPSIYSIVIPEQ